MKLESLRSSKFEPFENDVITNMFSIVGGKCMDTRRVQNGSPLNDRLSDDATQDKTWTDLDGSNPWKADWSEGICQVGPSVGMKPATVLMKNDIDFPGDIFEVEVEENHPGIPHM